MPTRKRATPAAPHQGEAKLLSLLNICQQLNAERDLAALFALAAREAARLLDAERASVFLLDPDTHELWSLVALGSAPIRFDARLGIAGASALTGQAINVPDALQDPRFYRGMDAHTGYQTRNLLAVPLRTHEGDITGTFEVLNKQGGPFTAADEVLLQAFAAQAAMALTTTQLVHALRHHRDQLLAENTQLWQEVAGKFATHHILGTSARIQQVVRLIERIHASSVDVLITGESGTGKELVAKAMHYTSPRARGPWVALNCAALPDSLLESELFGIEKGVATGVERRRGKFEVADGGTLFLDEIGDLSLPAQAKILRALQERVIERVGGRQALPVDVRILAATHKDLEGEITRGTFRADLYYRLNVLHLALPALREIREDIPLLAHAFLATYGREMLKPEPLALAPGALECLLRYRWPGNVRELANEMKRLVVLALRPVIMEEDLSEAIRSPGGAREPLQPLPARSLKETVAAVEQRAIREALDAWQQNHQRTAKALGLSRQGLLNKMKRYGIRTA